MTESKKITIPSFESRRGIYRTDLRSAPYRCACCGNWIWTDTNPWHYQIGDRHYHEDCISPFYNEDEKPYYCDNCGKYLEDGGWLVGEDEMYCVDCVDEVATPEEDPDD